MKRILVVSDTHIPDRASWIPRRVEEFIDENKPYDIAIHAGDLTSEEVLNWVKSLAPQVIVVEGNMDYLPLPREQVIEVEGIPIGVHHGHGVYPRGNPDQLARIAKRMNVTVLVTGHTHYPALQEHQGILIVNPGSLTGAWGGAGGSMRPSLALVEASQGKLCVEVYELRQGKLERILATQWPTTPQAKKL